MEGKSIHLPLTKQWFEMTKAGVKTEDYREITPYWVKRLINKDVFDYKKNPIFLDWYINLPKGTTLNDVTKNFTSNTMTLGYPKKTNSKRILNFEHKGIEIRGGNTDWGAEPNKLYFVIMHGAQLNTNL